jgi:epothilone polyketide synthase C
VPPLYKELRREAPATDSSVRALPDAVDLRARLTNASAEERRALLTDFIGNAVRDTLGITGSIDPVRSLQQYGLDSLMSITLINRLEAALGVRIPMARLVRGPSLDELVSGIVSESNEVATGVKMQESAQPQADSDRWLTVVSSRRNPSFRLFCFPFAGGGSAVYRTWIQSIRNDIEIVAIEPPGRLNRITEEPVSDINEFVEHVVLEVRDKLDRPFAFFGHCLGGLTMYETARRLRQTTSHQPRHLFVSGARPPDKLADQGDFEQRLLRDLMALAGFRINQPSHAQPEDVFAEVIRRFNILATEQLLDEPELRELMLPAIRAEFRMANNYIFRPEPPWDIPITCFYALQDPYVTRDHALGWGRFTNSRLQTHVRAGAHFAVIDDREFITGVINRECQI